MARRYGTVLVVALAGFVAASVARANVFNMPNGEVSLRFVTAGNPER